jgi:glycosyltransferase involved in cell wall biosynthesis
MIREKAAMKISIVTPSFNYGRFIEHTIRSIINQGWDEYEYFIVDAGSNDNTKEVVDKYLSDRVKFISIPGLGQAGAINYGWKLSTGNIFGWLNADDIYNEAAFREVAQYFEINKACEVLVGAYGHMNEDGIREEFIKRISEYDLNEILFRWRALPQPSCFWRRDICGLYGFLDESLNYALDWEYFLRLQMKNANFSFIPNKLIAIERWHKDQKARNSQGMTEEYARVSKTLYKQCYGNALNGTIKMIQYNRKLVMRKHGLLRMFSGFPNKQERAILRILFT